MYIVPYWLDYFLPFLTADFVKFMLRWNTINTYMNIVPYCPIIWVNRSLIFYLHTRLLTKNKEEHLFYYVTTIPMKFFYVRCLTNASFYKCLMLLETSNLLQTKTFPASAPPWIFTRYHESAELTCILWWSTPKNP
jgi:hypothetical protein